MSQLPNENNMKPSKFKPSILARRQQQNKANVPNLALHTPSRVEDSFKVSDHSYIRSDFKIDSHGLTHVPSNFGSNSSRSNTDLDGNVSNRSGILSDRSDASIYQFKHESFIKSFDEIRILGHLGQGQSANVSSAIHIPSKTIMAVKQISIYDKSKRHQMMNELYALYNTKCNGLVNFHDVFYSKGSVYIALEYCHCGSLADVLKKLPNGNIPELVLGLMTNNILDGLIHLHSRKNQVHRDLKPGNICLNKFGMAKLSDFGISKELKDSLSKCRTVVGTVTYMSPERIRAEEYNYKSDIWSLGILLFECIIGKFPYPTTQYYLELIQNIATEPPPKITNDIAKKYNLSKYFIDFIDKCLQKNPENRFNAKQLKQHEWIKYCINKNNNEKFDLSKWIKDNNLLIKLENIDQILSQSSSNSSNNSEKLSNNNFNINTNIHKHSPTIGQHGKNSFGKQKLDSYGQNKSKNDSKVYH